MSLIADALKAAQQERSERTRSDSAAQRRVAASALRTGGTASSIRRSPLANAPRSLWAAVAVLACASVVAAVIVVRSQFAADLAPPTRGDGVGEVLASALVGEGAGGTAGFGAGDSGPEGAGVGAGGEDGSGELDPDDASAAPVNDDSGAGRAIAAAGPGGGAGQPGATGTGASGGGPTGGGATGGGEGGLTGGGGTTGGGGSGAAASGGREAEDTDPDSDEQNRPAAAVSGISLPGAALPVQEAPGPLPVADPRAASGGAMELTLRDPGRLSEGLFSEALSAHRRGSYETAVELYRRLLESDPENAEVLNNLGTTLQAMGRVEEARSAYERALRLAPRNAAVWSNLGVLLGAMGQEDESVAALAEAIRLDPSNAGAMVNLALTYQERGLHTESRRLLEEVVAAEPRHPEAHYALARLLEESGDSADALEHYRLFLEYGGARFPQYEAAVRRRIEILEASGAR